MKKKIALFPVSIRKLGDQNIYDYNKQIEKELNIC